MLQLMKNATSLGCVTLLSLVLSACQADPQSDAARSGTPDQPGKAGREASEPSPVQRHGALSVKGATIVGHHGQAVSLAGPSLFWSNSGWKAERFYNAQVVKKVREDWNAGLIRAAMGVEDLGGYLHDPETNIAKVQAVVDAAIEEGLYVIIDWHSHKAEKRPDEAIKFFETMAAKYGDVPNVIYEIYNEPLEASGWSEAIKPYAEKVIAKIRAIDPDNLIVVGTRKWSQEVDEAAADPIEGYDNIVYTLHFYAGTHGAELRAKAKRALESGVALMVTEWGTVNADGDGGIAKAETQRWLEFMREHKLSHAMWSLHDKKEGASMLKPGAETNGSWDDEDFTKAGLYARSIIRGWSSPQDSGAKKE